MGWYGYDDYGYKEPKEPPKQAGAINIRGPIQAISKRGEIGVEWWGRQWVAALDRLMGDGRLDRGKRYARNGSVLDLEIAHGQVFAHVMGSHARRYHTYVRLKTFTNTEWESALKALSGQAIYTAKLLAEEMPADIEAIFDGMGSSLFPRDYKDIQFDCSCPDWGDPCKHSAAVYYLLAEQFDADPFILFHLRGRSREKVLEQLRAYRGESEDKPSAVSMEGMPEITASLDTDLTTFWRGAEVNLVRAMPLREDKPFAFRQLGDPPQGKADFLKIYNAIADEAVKWLGLDD